MRAGASGAERAAAVAEAAFQRSWEGQGGCSESLFGSGEVLRGECREGWTYLRRAAPDSVAQRLHALFRALISVCQHPDSEQCSNHTHGIDAQLEDHGRRHPCVSFRTYQAVRRPLAAHLVAIRSLR